MGQEFFRGWEESRSTGGELIRGSGEGLSAPPDAGGCKKVMKSYLF